MLDAELIVKPFEGEKTIAPDTSGVYERTRKQLVKGSVLIDICIIVDPLPEKPTRVIE